MRINKTIYKLYSNSIKLAYRFSSSIFLLILGLLVDRFLVEEFQKSWYLDFMLIFPIVSSITRFGLPLQILSKSIDSKNTIINIRKYQLCFVIFFGITYIITNNEMFLLLMICPIGSLLFNFGVAKIRNGDVKGYFFQNGLVYLILIISCFVSDVFFLYSKSIAIILLCFSMFYIFANIKIPLKKINLKNYFSDTLNSFIVPFIIFLAFKTGANLDAGDFIIIKATSLISSALSAMILLDFKKIDVIEDKIEKRNLFLSCRKNYINLYILLIVFITPLVIFLYSEKIFLLFSLIIFETLWFFKGQFNLLNIYFNNQLGIIKANCFTAISVFIVYLLIINLNFYFKEILLYIYGISCYQFLSYIQLKKYQNT